LPHRNRSRAIEIAQRNGDRRQPDERSFVPVIQSGQALAGEFRVCRRLIPTDSANRVLILAGRIDAAFPSRRSGPAGHVAKPTHRLFPGQLLSVLHEALFPVNAVLITALIDEFLVLTVGDFVLVDEIGLHRKVLEAAGGDCEFPGRNRYHA
jgi:hypothetical protein